MSVAVDTACIWAVSQRYVAVDSACIWAVTQCFVAVDTAWIWDVTQCHVAGHCLHLCRDPVLCCWTLPAFVP